MVTVSKLRVKFIGMISLFNVGPLISFKSVSELPSSRIRINHGVLKLYNCGYLKSTLWSCRVYQISYDQWWYEDWL